MFLSLQLNSLKDRLRCWKEVTAREFPNRPDLLQQIPDPDLISIDKLGENGVITKDTCNAAQKTRRILVKTIKGTAHEMDCMHHLRCVWINGVAKPSVLSCRNICMIPSTTFPISFESHLILPT